MIPRPNDWNADLWLNNNSCKCRQMMSGQGSCLPEAADDPLVMHYVKLELVYFWSVSWSTQWKRWTGWKGSLVLDTHTGNQSYWSAFLFPYFPFLFTVNSISNCDQWMKGKIIGFKPRERDQEKWKFGSEMWSWWKPRHEKIEISKSSTTCVTPKIVNRKQKRLM